MMQFFSDDKQDKFVANLLKFKRDGYYLDIGSCASVGSNNSYFFESQLNWKGICIEINPIFNDSYNQRNCRYVNQDALTIDYEKLFEEEKMPLSIDYLSLDIDEASVEALKKLPLDKYRFKAVTIEHDSHVHGDLYKKPQREILNSKGYHLLCADVLNQSGRNIGLSHNWEDWWVHPDFFTAEE
ncbi:MAG: FkbM family methyltransferase, partial [Nanoarchaeota archaeon]